MNDESLKDPIKAFLIMLLLGGIMSGVMMVALGMPIEEQPDTSNPKVVILFIVSTFFGISMALWFAVHRAGWSWLQFGALSTKEVALAIGMVPPVMLLSYAWSGLLESIGQVVEPQMFAQGIIESVDVGTLAFGLAYTIIAAPVLEETLFRGYMLPIMVRLLGRWQGIALNAILFGLVHASDPWAIVPTAAIGLVACWLWTKTGSLTAPVLFHVVNNMFAMGMLWLY